MSGYFRDEEATRAQSEGGWLRTGDLGYLAGGDLFITGRKKEIIIKGVQNLIPWVIEEIVGTVEGVRAGCVVAVGVYDRRICSERLHVVAETKEAPEAYEQLKDRVRAALGTRGASADQVTLLPPGSLPKTTSGKLKRGAVARELAERDGPKC